VPLELRHRVLVQVGEQLAHDAVGRLRSAPEFRVEVRPVLGLPHGRIHVVPEREQDRSVLAAPRRRERGPGEEREPPVARVEVPGGKIGLDGAWQVATELSRGSEIEMEGRRLWIHRDAAFVAGRGVIEPALAEGARGGLRDRLDRLRAQRISVSTMTPACARRSRSAASVARSMPGWRARASSTENIRCLSAHSIVG